MSLSGWGSSGFGGQHTILDRFFDPPPPCKSASPDVPEKIGILDRTEIATLLTDSPIPETPPAYVR